MRLVKLAAAAFTAAALALSASASAEGGGHELKKPPGGWSFEGFFGIYDQNQLQRGYRVYKEVCASCHGMELMSFRNLGEKGAPFFMSEYPNPTDNPKVKVIAAEYMLNDIDPETGDVIQVAGMPKDAFPSPYANEAAGRGMNGGAFPPDLSVIAKARVGGSDYLYSLLTGFYPAPEGLTVAPGQHYNAYFHGDTSAQWSGDPRHKPPGGFLAMAPPLTRDGQVTYDDGTSATVSQMAADVTAFLGWASEPKMHIRKQMGVAVIGYLAIFALLTYLSYRRIWRNIEH